MGAHTSIDDLNAWTDKELLETIDHNIGLMYGYENATTKLMAEAWSRGLYPKDEDGQLPKAA